MALVTTLDPTFLTSFGSDLTSSSLCCVATALGNTAWPMSPSLQQAWKTLALTTLARKEEWVRQNASKALAALDVGYGLADQEIEQYPLTIIVIISIQICLD